MKNYSKKRIKDIIFLFFPTIFCIMVYLIIALWEWDLLHMCKIGGSIFGWVFPEYFDCRIFWSYIRFFGIVQTIWFIVLITNKFWDWLNDEKENPKT